MKLLKPRTRIVIPVNLTTSAKEWWNSSARMGKVGASDKGPKPCMKVTKEEEKMAKAFHFGLQFYASVSNEKYSFNIISAYQRIVLV